MNLKIDAIVGVLWLQWRIDAGRKRSQALVSVVSPAVSEPCGDFKINCIEVSELSIISGDIINNFTNSDFRESKAAHLHSFCVSNKK